MKLKMFAVFDSKAGFFGQPWFVNREQEAIRVFSDSVNDGSNPSNMWFKHPEDFSLFELGEFDNESGEVVTCLPKNLVTASALRSARGNPQMEMNFNGQSAEKAPVN